MKKTAILLMLFSVTIYAQRANLDREYIKVSYVQLPSNPIMDNAQRTYSTNSSYVSVAGFSKVTDNGSLDINFSFSGTTIENIEIKKKKHEKKDKDGKVISVSYSYTLNAYFRSTGNLGVFNSLTAKQYNKRYSPSKHYTRTFTSYSKAASYLKNNKYSLKRKFRDNHRNEMIRKSKNYVNSTYGYPVVNQTQLIWILGSKKHPEYSEHHTYFNKMKAAFSKMNYIDPVANLESELKEVITYFENVVPKYPGKKKRYRKMRYASYYALAKIYYYLDNPSKSKEYGQKLIDNDYSKRDGKSCIKSANTLESRFSANETTTRHFDVLTEDLTQEPYTAEETVGDDVLAYLITKTNDTIKAKISNNNLLKISYGVDLTLTDSNGKVSMTHYKAAASKTLALTNEDVYEVIAFNEVKKGSVTSELKFAKVLFESSKISLYLFNNQELIIARPNEKGISTLSSDFAFGFNKKLATFCSDCPSLLNRTASKEFKNNAESLVSFCKAYNTCK